MSKEPYNADARRQTLQAFIARNSLKVQTWTKASGLSEAGLRAFLAGRADSMSDRTYEKLAAGASQLLGRPVEARELRGEPLIKNHLLAAPGYAPVFEGRNAFASYRLDQDSQTLNALAKALKERSAQSEAAPILDPGRTYLVTLWAGGGTGKTQVQRAFVIDVQMPLARIRDEKTGVESVINLTSPAFAGATRVDK